MMRKRNESRKMKRKKTSLMQKKKKKLNAARKKVMNVNHGIDPFSQLKNVVMLREIVVTGF